MAVFPPARHNTKHGSHADVFIPKLRPGFDEIAHELNARRVLQHFHLQALRADVFFRALKIFIFPDDDTRDVVKQHRAAAHWARRKRRIKNTALVNRSLEPSGVFEAVHFRMMNHAAVLHPLVVATPDNLAVQHEHRADGNAAFRHTFFGCLNRGLEKWIHVRIGTFPWCDDKCWWGERPREPKIRKICPQRLASSLAPPRSEERRVKKERSEQ